MRWIRDRKSPADTTECRFALFPTHVADLPNEEGKVIVWLEWYGYRWYYTDDTKNTLVEVWTTCDGNHKREKHTSFGGW